jgi:uncharacterized membrane protein
MSETITEKAEAVKDAVTPNGGGQSLAMKLLIPAAAGIGTLAATYGASKAPSLLRDKVMPRLEEKGSDELAEVGKDAASKMSGGGGLAGMAGKAASAVTGGGGGGGGREKTRRLPIQRWTDVAVPVETAYEKWTEFEEFPKFMHRVLSVQQEDDNRISWEEKIWFSKRQWEGKITERRKNDRIVWKTTSGMAHKGVVSFHELDDNLTRVMVDMEFEPNGMIEKMASGLRFVKRAVQADLARFKAYVEMEDARGIEYRAAKDEDEDEDKDKDESGNGSDDREQREKSRRERAEAGA